ncbi:hypothetical protein AcV7_006360 [Taiwanofungus camphoratus]|nr:hypothetical protein AcV7_006360 [Antrodia cinnamomea]
MYSSLKSVMQWTTSPKVSVPDHMCETCGVKPKFVEHGYQHPYCSRTCARNHSSKTVSCALQGCRSSGKAVNGGFCSDAHARDAVKMHQVQACAMCRSLPSTMGQLCVACNRHGDAGLTLREVDFKDIAYKSVVAKFLGAWSGGDWPTVEKVVGIAIPCDVQTRYDNHWGMLETTTSIQELTAYHSAQCICDFGVRDVGPCNWQSCGICNIIKSSFRAFAFGISCNSGRHGEGIYSCKNPALADKFATSSTSSPYRVMLACTVLAPRRGVGHDILTNSSGEVLCVNDSEKVFVNSADAIVPNYVILYTKKIRGTIL